MAPDLAHILAMATIVAVLIFDFTNGFHDASNMTASVVACGAMTPMRAVLVVSLFSLVGPILGGTAVANTIGKIVITDDLPASLASAIILAAILGATGWNLITWWFGLPSSSSHALVGGLVGAAMTAVGADHVVWGGNELLHGQLNGFAKIVFALLTSPLLGFATGYLLHRLMLLCLNPASPSINRYLKNFQYITSSGLAFSHGANDAQKSMGIITLLLLLDGQISAFEVPLWVMLLSALMITLGTLFGGWRIVRTLAFGLFKIRPIHALDSQLSSTLVILVASFLGAPVSTTHVVGSALMGIGTAEWPKRVRWTVAGEIAATWCITIPCSAAVAALIFHLIA